MGRLRGPLSAAFLLTALLTLVNVQAYSRATTASPATVTVTATETAALSLLPTSPMAQVVNSVLELDFARGAGATPPSFQLPVQGVPQVTGDEFRMLRVFEVRNNAAHCVDVAVYLTPGTVPNLFAIYGRNGSTSRTLYSGGRPLEAFRLSSGATMAVDFWWRATTSVSSSQPFQVTVTGTRCP